MATEALAKVELVLAEVADFEFSLLVVHIYPLHELVLRFLAQIAAQIQPRVLGENRGDNAHKQSALPRFDSDRRARCVQLRAGFVKDLSALETHNGAGGDPKRATATPRAPPLPRSLPAPAAARTPPVPASSSTQAALHPPR